MRCRETTKAKGYCRVARVENGFESVVSLSCQQINYQAIKDRWGGEVDKEVFTSSEWVVHCGLVACQNSKSTRKIQVYVKTVTSIKRKWKKDQWSTKKCIRRWSNDAEEWTNEGYTSAGGTEKGAEAASNPKAVFSFAVSRGSYRIVCKSQSPYYLATSMQCVC